MVKITYVKGDATEPLGPGPKIIANVCNDIGAWGRGFVLSISRKWPHAEVAYRRWFQDHPDTFKLGFTDVVHVDEDMWVANMIAQTGILPRRGVPPIRYDALDECLETLCTAAHGLNASVHMPRIGCGLAGGTWDNVGPLVQDRLAGRGIDVTVYDYVPKFIGDPAFIPAQIGKETERASSQRIGELRSQVR